MVRASARNPKSVRNRRLLLNGVAVMAAAPLIGLLGAGSAQAACSTSQGSPLVALQADEDVLCTGVTNGVGIVGQAPANQAAPSVQVSFGATLSSSVIILGGFTPYFLSETDSVLDGVSIGLNGYAPTATFRGTTGTIEVAALGDNGVISVQGGSDLFIGGFGIDLDGENALFELTTGSIIRADSAFSGPLIEGGAGAQTFRFSGSVFTGADGNLLVAGGGNDIIQLNNGMSGSGGSLVQIDGDGGAGAAGVDMLVIGGAGTYRLNAANIEVLNVTNAGNVVLQGFASWSVVNIAGASTLFIQNPAALSAPGGAQVDVESGATLRLVTSQSNVVLDQEFSGAGVIRLEGTSAFRLNGDNTDFTGQLILAAPQGVIFENQNALGGYQIVNNGPMSFGENLIVANAISGTGSVTYTGAGTSSLTGTNSYSGGTTVSSGILRVTGMSNLGTGAVSIAAGAELRFDNSADQTFSNPLSGAGTLGKTGVGRLTFTSPFTLGAVNVNQGSVRVNTVATTNVTVGAAGRLDGTGRIVGSLNNGGVVAPGNSIGTLTVQGAYTQGAAGILEIEFDSAGNIDLLDVSGTATLGGTLRFVSIGGAEGSGGVFLQAGGGVTGTFATVETVGAVLPLAVVYTSNNASMAPSVLTARPSTFNAQFQAASDTVVGFVDALPLSMVSNSEVNTVWAEGFAASAERSAEGASLGFAHDSYGITGGFSHRLGDTVTLGASLGVTRGEIGLESGGGDGEQDGLLGAVFGRYSTGVVTLGGGLVLGRIDQQTRRNVTFSGATTTVMGETSSSVSGAFGSVSGRIGTVGDWTVRASGGVSYVKQSQDGYQEGGASPLRLDVAGVDAETLSGQAAVGFDRSFPLEGGSDRRVDVSLVLGARYTDARDDRAIPVSFVGSGAGVTLQGDTRETVQGLVGLDIGYRLTGKVSLGVGYTGLFGESDRHEGRVGLYVGF